MKEEIEAWKIISKILEKHEYPNYESGVMTNFGSSQCDFKEKIKNIIALSGCNTSTRVAHFKDYLFVVLRKG